MPGVVLLPGVRQAMAATLRHTGHRFGTTKRAEYRELIRLSLATLGVDAKAGKQRPDARRRMNARHLLLYRIREAVEVGAFLHDVRAPVHRTA